MREIRQRQLPLLSSLPRRAYFEGLERLDVGLGASASVSALAQRKAASSQEKTPPVRSETCVLAS